MKPHDGKPGSLLSRNQHRQITSNFMKKCRGRFTDFAAQQLEVSLLIPQKGERQAR
jgi:hypothetical protein